MRDKKPPAPTQAALLTAVFPAKALEQRDATGHQIRVHTQLHRGQSFEGLCSSSVPQDSLGV